MGKGTDKLIGNVSVHMAEISAGWKTLHALQMPAVDPGAHGNGFSQHEAGLNLGGSSQRFAAAAAHVDRIKAPMLASKKAALVALDALAAHVQKKEKASILPWKSKSVTKAKEYITRIRGTLAQLEGKLEAFKKEGKATAESMQKIYVTYKEAGEAMKRETAAESD